LISKKLNILAIIPARAGSKRIYKKNLKKLQSKPLIAWTIEEAINSNVFSRIIVSTDSEEIAKIALHSGAEVPFMRPEEYSHDTASSTSVVEHAINYLSQKEGQYFDVIVLLQPSSPFRTSKHITEAVNLFIKNNAEAVVSVCLDEHKYSIGELPDNMSISDVIKDNKINFLSNLKSYRLNGAIYICKTNSFMEEKSFFISQNSFAYEMDFISSIDIDEMIDLFFAEAILKERARNGL